MDQQQLHILAELNEAEKQRLVRIKRQWAYYRGEPARPLRVMTGRPDDNVLLDLPRQLVDTSVAFLFGDDLEIEPVGDGEDGKLHEWLEDTYRQASPGGQGLLFQRLAVNGGVTGHAHAKIQPRPDGSLRVAVLDPETVTAEWHPDDVEDIVRWRIMWTTLDDQGHPVVRRQTIERRTEQSWAVIDEVSRGSVWGVINEAVWAFPFAPVVHCQNMPCPNEYFGLSDLEPSLLDLCDAINRVTSHIAKLVRIHGFPKVYTKGVGDVSEIQLGMDSILQLQGDQAEIGYLQNNGDINASLALYDRLKEALFEQARIPEVATGRIRNLGQMSGVARKIAYGPLVDKTEAKRRTYGTLVEELSARLLVVGGQAGNVEDARCLLKWPEIIPSDPKEEAETLQLHDDLGVVSRETMAGKLGYDYAHEKELMDEEGAQAADNGLGGFPMVPGNGRMVPADEPSGAS